jgi:hypothetical protein
MFSKCKYINCYGKRQETISLQDALNINKYARDIEILLPKLQPNYILDAMISSTEDEQTKINIIQNPSTDSATLRRFVKKNQEFYQEHKDIFPEGFEIKRTKNRNTKDDLSEGTR